jgi:hypothetical protein
MKARMTRFSLVAKLLMRLMTLPALPALPILALTTAVVAPAPAMAWSIQKTVGEVSLVVKGKKSAAKEGTELKEGDKLITGADGKALLKDGESEVWLGSATDFQVHKLADTTKAIMGRLDVLKGKLRAKFKRPSGPESYPYEVKMKSVVAGVRGTEFFVDVEGADEKLCTLEGLVRVTSAKSEADTWDVGAGHGLFIKPNEMPKVRETSAELQKKWTDATTF